MITVTSVEAQDRFGELIERAQREPVGVTRRGRTVAYVVCEADMQELVSLRQRREGAARWYAGYRCNVAEQAPADPGIPLTDADVVALVHEFR